MTAELTKPLQATLHHIALGSPDCEKLAQFHHRVMGLDIRPEGDGFLGTAPGRRVHFVPGAAKTLVFAGFAVVAQDDLDALEQRLVARKWTFDRLIEGTEQFLPGAIEVVDPDGNMMRFGLGRTADVPVPGALPARLQHVVVASTDAARLSLFYQEVLGFTLSDNVVDEDRTLKTAFLRCSEEHHSFAVFQASSNRFDHHCYEAREWSLIRDWGDHFAAQHVAVEWGPGRHGPGNNLFLFIHDLDGNWLEISAELEIVTPDRPVGEWPHAQRTLNQWGSAPLRT
ncbi:VOC family protein [Novosphingobium sp. RL4]|uniref:VOC family protein n=1 Tax=Novosphingobium sp. RL4 TaxID=3109595 RepID=UPI002D775ADA|nr:VOC family protein [Novosphingobium sp. RL4]WRT94427.1 VOC family protein [Novosphingobium sp. RL4]